MEPKETNGHVAAPGAEFKLVGYNNFVHHNPKSDRFGVKKFHHVEFWCTDATNTAGRFSGGLGMQIIAKSDLSTGNMVHASYVLRCGDLDYLVFTAPYSPSIAGNGDGGKNKDTASIPTFDHDACRAFTASHGLTVRAIGIHVEDAEVAFNRSVAHGAKPSSPPTILDNRAVIAEVHLYGDVVLRYVSFKNESDHNHQESCLFLPGFEPMDEKYYHSSVSPLDFGIKRLDHVVGGMWELGPAVSYVKRFTGFHEFAEFTAEDVGTDESGLNTVILASNNEMVLLVLSEPVLGTKRKSQIQTLLEHNEGPGVQHFALLTEDISTTLRLMMKRSGAGGFEFLPPPPNYYKYLKNRFGDILTDDQIKDCEELGILVDTDDQGTLLQIFTKPVGDRPTLYIEIIQRIGCMVKDEEGKTYQKGGCGGFGRGNFQEVFKLIEEYEKTLDVN